MAEFEAEDDYSDLVPIPQDDGPNPVVPITYPPLCELLLPYDNLCVAIDSWCLTNYCQVYDPLCWLLANAYDVQCNC